MYPKAGKMDTNVRFLVIGILAGVAAAVLVLLILYQAHRWWVYWRYGVPVDHSVLLVEYGRRMTGALDRDTLARLLTGELPGELQAQRATLLLAEQHQLVDADAAGAALPVSHSAVRWVASAGEAQRADDGHLARMIAQGRTDLAWARVWVPLMRGTELHGMWLLGERAEGKLYAPADLSCLTALGRQAAIVLESARYAEQERQTASEIRALYRQVVIAREEERGRLARELHDGVLQDLCAVTRDLRARDAQHEDGLWILSGVVDRAGEVVQSLRAICNDLRPPLLQSDLGSALKALGETLDSRSGAPISVEIAADDLRLSPEAALALFRIVQEALHNAIQHADASEIAVRLTRYPDHLRLTVTDDGCGIQGGADSVRFVAQGHFGVAGMRERASMIGARLDIQTALEYGTVVSVELPC
jgi:signal transduction histidine kinase